MAEEESTGMSTYTPVASCEAGRWDGGCGRVSGCGDAEERLRLCLRLRLGALALALALASGGRGEEAITVCATLNASGGRDEGMDGWIDSSC